MRNSTVAKQWRHIEMLFVLFLHKALLNSQEWIKYTECDWDSGKAERQLILVLILHFY